MPGQFTPTLRWPTCGSIPTRRNWAANLSTTAVSCFTFWDCSHSTLPRSIFLAWGDQPIRQTTRRRHHALKDFRAPPSYLDLLVLLGGHALCH